MNWQTFKEYINIRAIITFIVISLIFIFLLFFMCNKNKDLLIEPSKPVLIIKNIDYPAINSDQNQVYFLDKKTNKLGQINIKTKKTGELYAKNFKNIYLLSWASDLKKVIISQTEDHVGDDIYEYKNQTFLIDIASQKEQILPLALDDAVWSPDNQHIAYSMAADENLDQTNIVVANPDGTGPEIMKTLSTKGAPVKIVWSSQNELLVLKEYFNQPENYDINETEKESAFYRYNLSNKKTSLIEGKQITDFTATNNGQTIFFTSESEDSTSSLLDSKGRHNINSFPFNSLRSTVWPNDQKMLYSVSNKFIERKPNSLAIHKLDLSNYQTSKVVDLIIDTEDKNNFNIVDATLMSSDQKKIYFLIDSSLYKFDL